VCLAIPVDGAVNFILPVLQRALLLPKVKRTAQMCFCRTNKIQPSTPSNRKICYQHRSEDEKLQGDDAAFQDAYGNGR